MYKILLVEDEELIRNFIKEYFSKKEIEIIEASDGLEAIELFRDDFDLVLLDIMMPHLNGYEVCRKIRDIKQTPIIFISALFEDEDQLKAYELGADDYITKPFKPSLLYAKCMALIKRDKKLLPTIKVGDLVLHTDTHEIEIDFEKKSLSNKEFSLLMYFVENKDILLTRDQILNKIWGYDYYGDARAVDTYVKMLRKNLKGCSNYIHTVIKSGYRFSIEDSQNEE